jgi:hypothetical protein
MTYEVEITPFSNKGCIEAYTVDAPSPEIAKKIVLTGCGMDDRSIKKVTIKEQKVAA